MITGTVCMSHTPLMDRKRAAPDVEKRFFQVINDLSARIAADEPDLAIVFFPDHYNGFFYNLMPSFCIGIEGHSVGDYGTAPGTLDIPAKLAEDCARHCLDAGVDVAVSYRMACDHGAIQPLELLSGDRPLTRVIPIFVNSAAAPRPTLERVCALGDAVGAWAAARPERILVIASGGLSHDPPLPQLATADARVRENLIAGKSLNYTDRFTRQSRVLAMGDVFSAGSSSMRPLNEAWDRALLDALADGRLDAFDHVSDAAITEDGGCGGHEVRTWFAAMAAAAHGNLPPADIAYYEAIPEWITGCGILAALRASAA